jgi:hypothetical protein
MFGSLDTTYAVLFREMISINYWNLIETITVIFEKVAILCFGAQLKGPYFWSWNVRIHWADIIVAYRQMAFQKPRILIQGAQY